MDINTTTLLIIVILTVVANVSFLYLRRQGQAKSKALAENGFDTYTNLAMLALEGAKSTTSNEAEFNWKSFEKSSAFTWLEGIELLEAALQRWHTGDVSCVSQLLAACLCCQVTSRNTFLTLPETKEELFYFQIVFRLKGSDSDPYESFERLDKKFQVSSNAETFGLGFVLIVTLFSHWEKETGSLRYAWRSGIRALIRYYRMMLFPPTHRTAFLNALRSIFDSFYVETTQSDELGFALNLLDTWHHGNVSDFLATLIESPGINDDIAAMHKFFTQLNNDHLSNNNSLLPPSITYDFCQLLGITTLPGNADHVFIKLRSLLKSHAVVWPVRIGNEVHIHVFHFNAVYRYTCQFTELMTCLGELWQYLPNIDAYQRLPADERECDVEALLKTSPNECQKILKRLFDHFIGFAKPLDDRWRPLPALLDVVGGIYYIVDGAIPSIPMHILISDKMYVMDRWSISYMPSFDALYSILAASDKNTGESKSGKALVLVGHDGASNDDISTLRKYYGSSLHTQICDGIAYDVFHFCGHGISHPDGRLFEMSFFNGCIRTDDILKQRIRASLIFLNACDIGSMTTGSAENFPMIISFLCMGARSIIASQWPIHDGCGRRVSELFYQCYIERGMSPYSAFSEAVQQIRKELPHPLLWGGYTYCGILTEHPVDQLVYMGNLLNNEGYLSMQAGSLEQARMNLHDAVLFFREASDIEGELIALQNKSTVEARLGRIDLAVKCIYDEIALRALQGWMGEELLAITGQAIAEVLGSSATTSWIEHELGFQEAFKRRNLNMQNYGLPPHEKEQIFFVDSGVLRIDQLN